MAITQNNLPREMQAGAAVRVNPNDPYPDIQARPLQMPDFVDLKPVNPQVSLRWCNRVAGEGQRMDQVTYAGFIPCVPADVKYPNGRPVPSSLVKEGHVVFGDLILMKIDRKAYDGALKYNWERAVQRLRPGSNKKTGDQELHKTLSEAGIRQTPELLKKLSTFQPTDAEIEAGEKAGK